MVKKAAAGPVEGRWALPDGWSWHRAKDIAKIVGGSTPKNAADTTNYSEDGTPWLTPADLSGYSKSTIGQGRRNLAPHVVNRSALLPAGAVLISSRAPVGYCAIASNPMVTNQGFRSLILADHLDPFFVRYYVLFSRKYLEDHASGTTFKELSGSALGELVFPVPPLYVQRGIVARIDELFAEIDDGEAALARARDDLATWRKTLLNAAVTGKLTADWRAANSPSGTGVDLLDEILAARRARWIANPKNRGKRYPEPATPNVGALPNLPAGWRWATMDQLSWASGYGTSERCSAEHTGTPVLRIPNVRRGIVSLNDLKYTAAPLPLEDGRALSVGDLLIVRTNGSDDLIGRAALVLTPPPETSYFASYLIRLRLLGSIEVLHWIALLIDSPVFRASVLRSIASSAGQYNLSLSKIETFAVPIPPRDEIEAVISRLHAAQAGAADGERLLDNASLTAATLRQSVLAAAFRGELA